MPLNSDQNDRKGTNWITQFQQQLQAELDERRKGRKRYRTPRKSRLPTLDKFIELFEGGESNISSLARECGISYQLQRNMLATFNYMDIFPRI